MDVVIKCEIYIIQSPLPYAKRGFNLALVDAALFQQCNSTLSHLREQRVRKSSLLVVSYHFKGHGQTGRYVILRQEIELSRWWYTHTTKKDNKQGKDC